MARESERSPLVERAAPAWVVLLALYLFTVAAAQAQDRRVQDYFDSLRSLQADFTQTVVDADGRVMQASLGTMWMQQPGRFRWDYSEPFEQVVVADGQRLWHYDPGLAQVTVQPLDTTLSSTPLALLSGARPLEELLTVETLPSQGAVDWYRLRPREPQAEFESLRLAFRDGDLAVIELEDALGQLTRLALEGVQRNPGVDPALFQFTPPPGADVVGEAP